jgi:hypothetical protein
MNEFKEKEVEIVVEYAEYSPRFASTYSKRVHCAPN